MSKSKDRTTEESIEEASASQYTIITNAAKFSPGQIVATPGAIALMDRSNTNPATLLSRHLHGDWGDTCVEDAAMNQQALTDGSRLMSVYRLVSPQALSQTPKNKRSDLPTIWLISEALGEDGTRASTCFLLPSEY